jgi:hypothetical protein
MRWSLAPTAQGLRFWGRGVMGRVRHQSTGTGTQAPVPQPGMLRDVEELKAAIAHAAEPRSHPQRLFYSIMNCIHPELNATFAEKVCRLAMPFSILLNLCFVFFFSFLFFFFFFLKVTMAQHAWSLGRSKIDSERYFSAYLRVHISCHEPLDIDDLLRHADRVGVQLPPVFFFKKTTQSTEKK